MHLTHTGDELKNRPVEFIATDTKVVRWIAQAAVNVELFTIPLYMVSLYSVTGMHPITSQGNDFYKGRQWPGAKTSSLIDREPDRPGWGNKRAFNIVFSVFIQEMLHLQMAANIATAIGAVPSFTATALQNAQHGWVCYGPTLTRIPTIVDLTDTKSYADVKVNVGPLDPERLQLFRAIEAPQETAEADIVRNKKRYFPAVPFDGKNPDFDPATADIMFGSIGYMYQCYRDYLLIEYADGTRLWDHVFNAVGQQNDLFNYFSFPGHPMREFMGFETTIALTDKDIALEQALNMMNAITDQGEGGTLKTRLKAENPGKSLRMIQGEVEQRYCANPDALKSDYPSYSQTGAQIPSADAAARHDNDGMDHYTRFREVEDLWYSMKGVLTWDQAGKAGNWKAEDLVTADYDPSSNPYGLPTPERVATALNNLYKADVRDANFATMSQAVVGAIKGVTTVLDNYWNPGDATVSFPFPSMSGSGDRMSTCWAVFGKTPDLSVGVEPPNTSIVNHACQGLSFNSTGDGGIGTNSCAETPIYHTCRGSNLCKGMGGCGFVQATSGGGSCGGSKSNAPQASPTTASCGGGGGSCGAPTPNQPTGGGCSAVKLRTFGGLCGTPTPSPSPTPGKTHYTAPSDNICGGFGGCAVPIAAMQLYPKAGTMDVYQLSAAHGCGQFPAKKIGEVAFKVGDKVEDVAFNAFKMVAKQMGYPEPTQADPNDLRLAYPPST